MWCHGWCWRTILYELSKSSCQGGRTLCASTREAKDRGNITGTIRIEFQCPPQFSNHTSVGRWQWQNGSAIDELHPILLSPLPHQDIQGRQGSLYPFLAPMSGRRNESTFLGLYGRAIKEIPFFGD